MKRTEMITTATFAQGELGQMVWHGGHQGEVEGGTWHGGRQGEVEGGTWH